jgi:hypothetical protein
VSSSVLRALSSAVMLSVSDGPHPPIGNHEVIERERPIEPCGITYEVSPGEAGPSSCIAKRTSRDGGCTSGGIMNRLRRMRFAWGFIASL